MENNENIEKKPENTAQNGTKQIIATIIVVGVFIVGAILLPGRKPADNTANEANQADLANIQIRPVSADEHILGDANAELIIVEYSDTECPFCKRFHTTMQEVMRTNGAKVAWVYRHYPIPQLHQKAFTEAVATECAWEQGGNTAFWDYTDEVYARTGSNDSLATTELPKIASDIGLDVSAFNTCLLSDKYNTKIETDINDGHVVGVRGTPTSFILKGGIVVDVIEGAQPIEIIQDKIKKLTR